MADGRGAARRLVLVGGPTASGKSALALAIAERQGGVVVNADAMQVYGVLRILTNRPGPEDEGRAPHRLFGVLPPDEACSAARWRTMATAACEEAWAAGRLPVLVGGTGLYFRALMHGLSPIPEIPDAIRAATRDLFAAAGNAHFHAMLASRDPAMAARLAPGDSQRLMRAWEVFAATGRSLADWQRARAGGDIGAAAFSILVMPPRAQLHSACDARFLAMLERGALDEVRALLALRLDPALPAMKALGVPQLAAHLRGEITLAEATALAQAATRQYAKRQSTWFRHQWSPDHLIDAQYSERTENEIFSKIRDFLLTAG